LPKYGILPSRDWKKPPSLETQKRFGSENWISKNRKSLSVNTHIDREALSMETAIYGRVSTDEQAMEGYSIRGQVEKLKSYVSAKSWSIYDVYLDEGISGKNMIERPAITRMMKDIEAGRVKNVLVFKLDRLTRSVADLVYLIDLFKEYDCAFNSLSESIDTSTASGRMFLKIIGIFAEFERENIGERVRLGKERKAREGYTTAGARVSYGYKRNKGDKVQQIDTKEAETVKRIFDMYVNQNFSLTKIAGTLNLEKIPSKQGGTWNTGVIINLMKNPNYIGYVRYGKDSPERYFETKGKHEAIINEEMYNEAQLLLEHSKFVSPTKKPREKNYFTGFLRCGVCGKRLVPHINYNNKEKKPQYHFFCAGRRDKVCEAKKLSLLKFEKAFVEYVSTLNAQPDNEQLEKEAEAKRAAAARVETLRERITTLEAKEKEMLDSYIEDNASLAEYRGVKVQLDGEKARILAEIETLIPPEKPGYNINQAAQLTKEEIITALQKHWGNFTDVEKRQFLLKHIIKIAVVNHPVKGSTYGNVEILDIEYNTNT